MSRMFLLCLNRWPSGGLSGEQVNKHLVEVTLIYLHFTLNVYFFGMNDAVCM